MSALLQQAVEIIDRLDEKEKNIAINFLQQLFDAKEYRRLKNNEAYLAKLDLSFMQFEEGKHSIRELVEVDDE